jgi:hypothetical protein
MRHRHVVSALALAGLFVFVLGLLPAPAAAGSVEKSVNFALDEWIDLSSTDGPTTLHRVRLARQGGFTKSKFMRPGSSDYLEDVQIQLEFTNESSKDWDAEIVFEWFDADGKLIDGYKGTESLDSESKQDDQTITLSTLKYGLQRAKKLKLRIDYEKD